MRKKMNLLVVLCVCLLSGCRSQQINIAQIDIPYELKEISMCCEEKGWALTAQNEVLFTDSGVEDFAPVRKLDGVSSENDGAVDVCFVDERTVYAAYLSEDGSLTVEYTKDGGNSWQQTLVNFDDRQLEAGGSAYISFSDADHGYLLYCSTPAMGQMTKLLFYTEDAGESFSYESDLSGELTGYPQGISFAGGRGYIAVTYHGENNYLYVKESATELWRSEAVFPMPDEIQYIDGFAPVFDMEDGQKGMLVLKAVGEDVRYMLFVTTDGGESWMQNGEIPFASLNGYCYVGDDQFYLIDGTGSLYEPL